jgi:hypothetical protein
MHEPDGQELNAASRWEQWKFRLAVRLGARCPQCGIRMGHLGHPLAAYGCPVHRAVSRERSRGW